jgi:hypothetical protein
VDAYVVGLLLILVSLLVGSSLGLIRGALLLAQSLPALTEDLADLAWREGSETCQMPRNKNTKLTERDTGVLLTDVLTLLIGKEHVGRQTTLGSIGV